METNSEMKECWKMFEAPKEYGKYIAIFCTWEDREAFYGYLIGREQQTKTVLMKFTNPKVKCFLYYSSKIKFPKSVPYVRMDCPYHLKKLRLLVERANTKPDNHTTYYSDSCKKNTVVNLTSEQQSNRKNKELIEEFHTLKKQLEIAEMTNNSAAAQKIGIRLTKLRKMLGYPSGKRNHKERTQLTHYYKPFQGGGCTPK